MYVHLFIDVKTQEWWWQVAALMVWYC